MTSPRPADTPQSGEAGARPFVPARASLPALRQAVQACHGCPLYKDATQAVFGEGVASARVILVGEQPGNDEDLQGRPFVGPAGRILDEGLSAAGIDRSDAYVTNVVKHFKYQWSAKASRRRHVRPGAAEIAACLPWLEKEIELLGPEVLVCLGATAAQALLGRAFRVSVQHGQVVANPWTRHAVATLHPSAVLRQPDRATRHAAMRQFTADLEVVAALLRGETDHSALTAAPAARPK